MLDRIINFKNSLIENCNNQNIDEFVNIDVFIERIRETQFTVGLQIRNNTYWKNYLHATLVSAYQMQTSYDLLRWNEFFGRVEQINDIFNIKGKNEGEILELFVLHSINNVFNFGDNLLFIKAFKANADSEPQYLLDDSNQINILSEEENNILISNLKISMKLRGLPKKEIWGDNDVIVTLRKNNILQQFCIISCKTSLRERVYQSIFWSMHSRLESIGKHVFVTPDKGRSGNSEIGHRKDDNSANKSRDVLESTMDRVYVLRNSNEVGRSQVIKDFIDLEKDLLNWANDIAGV